MSFWDYKKSNIKKYNYMHFFARMRRIFVDFRYDKYFMLFYSNFCENKWNLKSINVRLKTLDNYFICAEVFEWTIHNNIYHFQSQLNRPFEHEKIKKINSPTH